MQIHVPDDEAMDAAKTLNDRAIAIYTHGMRTGEWPGYDLVAEPTSLPTYYFYENEEALGIDPDAPLEVELKL